MLSFVQLHYLFLVIGEAVVTCQYGRKSTAAQELVWKSYPGRMSAIFNQVIHQASIDRSHAAEIILISANSVFIE